MLIKPSKGSIKSVLEKIRSIIKANKTAKQSSLIILLNPILRGWANYHRLAVAKKAFNSVDNHVWQLLWRWAKRRHPKKRWPWIKNRYYHRIHGRQGVFATELRSLYLVNQTPIVRHIKIRSDANPFDPAYRDYFTARRLRAVGRRLSNRRSLHRLWREQDGTCPVCLQSFVSEDEWQRSYSVQRNPGSQAAPTPLPLLHPNCHGQLLRKHESLTSRAHERAFARLEPDEEKSSRPVLRGRGW